MIDAQTINFMRRLGFPESEIRRAIREDKPTIHIPTDGNVMYEKSHDYWQGWSDGLRGAEYNNELLKELTDKAYDRGYKIGKEEGTKEGFKAGYEQGIERREMLEHEVFEKIDSACEKMKVKVDEAIEGLRILFLGEDEDADSN